MSVTVTDSALTCVRCHARTALDDAQFSYDDPWAPERRCLCRACWAWLADHQGELTARQAINEALADAAPADAGAGSPLETPDPNGDGTDGTDGGA